MKHSSRKFSPVHSPKNKEQSSALTTLLSLLLYKSHFIFHKFYKTLFLKKHPSKASSLYGAFTQQRENCKKICIEKNCQFVGKTTVWRQKRCGTNIFTWKKSMQIFPNFPSVVRPLYIKRNFHVLSLCCFVLANGGKLQVRSVSRGGRKDSNGTSRALFNSSCSSSSSYNSLRLIAYTFGLLSSVSSFSSSSSSS